MKGNRNVTSRGLKEKEQFLPSQQLTDVSLQCWLFAKGQAHVHC